MIISDETSVMLTVEPFFKGSIEPQEIADTSFIHMDMSAIPAG